MPTQKMIDLQERMSDHMDEILRCFKAGAKITVVVRNPSLDDADVVIGNDDLDAAIAAIQVTKSRNPTFIQGEPIPAPSPEAKTSL